jgi:hypothetical protein
MIKHKWLGLIKKWSMAIEMFSWAMNHQMKWWWVDKNQGIAVWVIIFISAESRSIDSDFY